MTLQKLRYLPHNYSGTAPNIFNATGGPFQSSGGDLYVVAREGTTALVVYKSTDDGASWARQSTWNPTATGTIQDYHAVQHGDTIHAWTTDHSALTIDLDHNTFSMSTDSWGTQDTIINAATSGGSFGQVHGAVRSDGDEIVIYNGASEKVKGTEYERVYWQRDEGSGYGNETLLPGQSGVSRHYQAPASIKGVSSTAPVVTIQHALRGDTSTTNYERLATEFTPRNLNEARFDAVTLGVQSVGSPTGNLYLDIYTDAATPGAGTLIATSAAVAESGVASTLNAMVAFTFASAVNLDVGTKYQFVLRRSGTDETNYIIWNGHDTISYAGGSSWTRNTAGTWTEDTTGSYMMTVPGGGATAFSSIDDLIHVFWFDAGNDDVRHASIDQGNNVSTAEDVDTTASTADSYPIWQPSVYSDAGVERVTVVYLNSDSTPYSAEIDDDGSPSTPEQVSNVSDTTSEHSVADGGTKKAYALFESVDRLSFDVNTDSGGWGTDSILLESDADQSQTTATANFALGDATARTKLAQKVNPATAQDLVYVALTLDKVGSPTDNFIVEIWKGGATPEAGTKVGSVVTAGADVPATTQEVTIAVIGYDSATPHEIDPASDYYIVCRRSGSVDGSNYYRVQGSTGSSYSGGGLWTHNGTGWGSESSTDDAMFRFPRAQVQSAGLTADVYVNSSGDVVIGGLFETTDNRVYFFEWVLIAGGTAHQRTSTDALGVTDATTPAKDAAQTVTDDAGITDATSRVASAARTITDPVGATDTVTTAKTIKVTATDSLGVTDTITPAITKQRTVTDPLGATDSTTPVKDASQTITDSVGVTDQTSRTVDATRTITDDLGVTDQTSRGIYSTVTDPVGITDQTSRVAPAVRTVTDPVGVSDQTSEEEANRETIPDSLGVTDSTTRVHAAHRTITDPVGVTDATATAKTIQITVTDPVGATDSTAAAKTVAATVTDPVGITDQISAVGDKYRTFTDPVGVTDQTSSAQSHKRTVTDGLGVTDATVDVLQIAVTVTDDLGVTDSTSRVAPAERTVTDPVGISDQTSENEENRETVPDSAGVTDTTTRVHAAKRTVTDPVGISDQTTPVKTIAVTVTDPVGVADTVTPVKTAAVTVTDPAGVTDTTARDHTAERTITDDLGVTDATSEVLAGAGEETATDPVGITDSVSRDITAERTATDDLGVADLVSPAKTIDRTATDPVGVTDATSPAKTIQVTVTDTLGVADTVTPVEAGGIFETATDPVGVTDSTTRVHDLVRTITDDLGMTDLVSTVESGANTETATDDLEVTDQVTAVKNIVVTISDDLGAGDQTSPTKTGTVTIVETVAISDQTTRVHAAHRTVTETLGATDQIDLGGTIYLPWWEYDPVDAVADPVGYTKDPVGFDKVKRTDQTPW